VTAAEARPIEAGACKKSSYGGRSIAGGAKNSMTMSSRLGD